MPNTTTAPPTDFTPEELVMAIIQARADGDTDAAVHLMTLLKEPDDDGETPMQKAWKSDEHPRSDDDGRFIDAHDLHEAHSNARKARP